MRAPVNINPRGVGSACMSVRDRVAIHFSEKLRSQALAPLLLATAVLLGACSIRPPDDAVIVSTMDVAVSGDAPQEISRELDPGIYLVEIRERDIDLDVAVAGADGERAELTDQIPRHGAHYKVMRLTTAARATITLRSTDHRSKRGLARITIARFHRALDGVPTERERGFVAFEIAGAQTRHSTKESWARATDQLHQAITHFEAAHDETSAAQAQYSLAHLQYLARMEWTASIRAADAAHELFDELEDELGQHRAQSLRAAAELEIASGMNAGTQRAEQRALYKTADRRLGEAAEYFAAHGEGVSAEYAVNMRGIAALYSGDYERAGEFFDQAAKLAIANQDVGEQARSLANLAWVQNRLGFIAQAAEGYAALLPLVDRDRQPSQYASLLGNYGFCLISLGDFDKALTLHTEALDLFRQTGNEAEQARQLSALGGLYFRMGNMERALQTLDAAIRAHERAADGIAHAGSLRVAGNAAAALGRHSLALEYLRRSAEIDGNSHSAARTRVLIAGELRTLGDLRGAEAELGQALESRNALVRANAIGERAYLRMARQDRAGAIDDLRAADREYVRLGLEFNRIDTNTALSEVLLAAHDFRGALLAADEAVSIVGRIRVKSANPEWRARFASARYAPYEARIAADFALSGIADAQAIWRGFRTAEQLRARSLADRLAGNARQVRVDPIGDSLRAHLTSQQLRLEQRVQRQDADDIDTIDLRRTIEETRARLAAHELGDAAIATSDNRLPETLRELQSQLPADTAALAYFVGDRRTHAWLLTRRELRHALLEGRPTLQSAVDAATAQLRDPEARQVDGPIGMRILGSLLEGVTEKRLLVIPDGPLNGIPFAPLPLGNGMVIDRFVVGYAPSITLALQSAPQQQNPPTQVVVVSDPVYAPDDRRFMTLVAANGAPANLRSPRAPSANRLTRLPYSALEARAVVKAFGAQRTTVLEGFEAIAPRVLALRNHPLAVLHFATHAQPRKEAPEDSVLYLSEYHVDGSLRSDSRLTAREITRSGLHASIVVLSGCGTGDGGELRGEGVLGLTYGFLANGSGAVVAALWPIEDASTARLMNEFYLAYRSTGRAAEALRTAQLRTRGHAARAVWSSFVVRANGFP